jgi:Tfp pilus assembly PilM family ATPase
MNPEWRFRMRSRLRHLAVLLGRLRRFGRNKRRRTPAIVTALDIDGTILRVAQAGPRARVFRIAAISLELPPDADRNDPLVMGVAVNRALNKINLKPGAVVMGVPRAKVLLRTLTLPVVEKLPELASLVHFQIGKDLPFRMDEAVVDFRVRRQVFAPPERSEPAGKPDPAADAVAVAPRLEVLVATVKREVVDFHLRLADAAGFKLQALGLLPYANARCVQACHVADGDAAFALVSLRPDEVGIDIIAQQSLLFSRGAAIRAPADAAPSVQAEALARAAVIEVVRSIHGYSGMEVQPVVDKIVISGATGLESQVAAALSERLETPCALLDTVGALKLPPESADHAPGSVAAMGLAFGFADTQGLPFDFLNPKKPAVQRDVRRIQILSAAAAAAVLIVTVLTIRTVLVSRRETELAKVNAELSDAESKRSTYKRLIAQAGVVEDWIKGDRDWLVHYAYLTSILPPSDEIYLTSIAVSGQGGIRLAVQARNGETLARLEKQLRNAGYDVKPLAITPGADRFGYEFRSNVELLVPDKLKIDLFKVKPPARPLDDVSLEPAAWRKGAQ